jgi:hypothetical protein
MIEGSLHEGGNRSAAPIIRSEVPRDRYPLPALNTPEANKSRNGYGGAAGSEIGSALV